MSSRTQNVQITESDKRSTLEMPGDNLVPPDFKSPASSAFANEYIELKHLIKQKGLLNQQPAYYTYKILFTLSLLSLSIAFLLILNNFWFQLLNAVYMAFVFTQIGFLVHDLGHRQIFRIPWKIVFSSFIMSNLLLGWSWSWWNDRHNQHHGHPNQLDLDPDIDTPFFSFSEENAYSKAKFLRFIVKYQAYFFFPLQVLASVAFLIWSIQFLIQKKPTYYLTEAMLMVAHYLMYFGLLFSLLDTWNALLFIIIHQAFIGLYIGSVFAPNHKGMPVWDKDKPLDFLRQQVLTSRNVKASPFTDFWYGGLNYQIEHHLFPTIPRNKLKEAQHVVKAFCKAHSIAYHETSLLQSYKEILHCLHEASAPLRNCRR